MADYIYMMESRLLPEQMRGVHLVRDVARAHEMNVYLTGGVVRDIIGGANIRDLDFAVQGNALKLVKDLEKAGAVIQGTDETLRTVFVLLPGNLRGEIASTRAEKYDKPGKPPEIEWATISEDLRRRDFTMNAMALSLNPGSRGLLSDPFNGVADIESKHIRILHNYAFLEDPSRMVRAIRFGARFEWTMDERTKARYDTARDNDYIDHINRKLIGHEIEQIAHENDPLKVMRALEKEDYLKVLHPHWSVAKVDVSGLNHLMKFRQQMLDLGYYMDAGPAVMSYITAKMNSTDVHQLELAIPRKAFVHAWKHLEDDAKDFAKRLTAKDLESNSASWRFLSAAKPESILYTALTTKNSAASRKISDFFGKWRQLRQRLPFPEMAELRITPELPDYKKLEEEAFMLLLDNKLKTQAEIIKFLTPYSPPLPVAPPTPARRGRGAKKAVAKAPPPLAGVVAVDAGKGKRGRKPKAAGDVAVLKGAVMANVLENAAAAVGGAVGKLVNAAKAVVPVRSKAPAAKKKVAAPAKKKAAKPAAKKAGKPAAKKSVKKGPAKKAGKKKK